MPNCLYCGANTRSSDEEIPVCLECIANPDRRLYFLESRVSKPDRRFILVLRDQTGHVTDASSYTLDSLNEAGMTAHEIMARNGRDVTILDRSTTPPTEYRIDIGARPVRTSKP
jgi:hypothetical protein